MIDSFTIDNMREIRRYIDIVYGIKATGKVLNDRKKFFFTQNVERNFI